MQATPLKRRGTEEAEGIFWKMLLPTLCSERKKKNALSAKDGAPIAWEETEKAWASRPEKKKINSFARIASEPELVLPLLLSLIPSIVGAHSSWQVAVTRA